MLDQLSPLHLSIRARDVYRRQPICRLPQRIVNLADVVQTHLAGGEKGNLHGRACAAKHAGGMGGLRGINPAGGEKEQAG